MVMHEEVRQGYEERLKDKDWQIERLTHELELAKREPIAIPAPETTEQSTRSLWGWLFGS